MTTANHASAGTQVHGCNHASVRAFVRNGSTVTYYLYGLGGERLMEFQETCTGGACGGYTETQRWIYFAGRKMFSKTGSTLKAVTPNRLASEAKHFPYGETDGTPPADTKDYFATYRRDGTGLDYAWNRYYSPTMGRFTTADPYEGSVAPGVPGTWNQYTYVTNSPVTYLDSAGLFLESYSGPGSYWIICALDPFGAMSTSASACRNSPNSEEMWSMLGSSVFNVPFVDTTEIERRSRLNLLRDSLVSTVSALVTRRRGQDPSASSVPKCLEVVSDCWSPAVPAAGTLAYTRVITYQIQDSGGNPMSGASLLGVFIFERLIEVVGNEGAAREEGTWSIAGGSISADGTITDYLSAGGIGALGGSPWSAFQVFYVASLTRTLMPMFHALVVKGHGVIDTSVLDNRYYNNNVTVNGIGYSKLEERRCQ
jgi:RHS repeat-associated protein